MLLYPSAMTLSNRTLDYVARLIRRHRVSIGSRWPRLSSSRQALLVLAHLRNGDTYQRLATGFGIGLATAYRYIRETTDLLAARAPSLDRAVTRLAGSFSNYALLDGTVIRIDRCGDFGKLNWPRFGILIWPRRLGCGIGRHLDVAPPAAVGAGAAL